MRLISDEELLLCNARQIVDECNSALSYGDDIGSVEASTFAHKLLMHGVSDSETLFCQALAGFTGVPRQMLTNVGRWFQDYVPTICMTSAFRNAGGIIGLKTQAKRRNQ